MVTTQGFNALLKIVEEPPEHLDLRLRHHRAGEGAADHPVAHPPLPVPADPAGDAARPAGADLRRRRASTVDAGGAPAGGPGRRRLGPRLAVGARPAARRAPAPRASPTRGRSALLGVTDVALLDDVVDALAAGDARGACSAPSTGSSRPGTTRAGSPPTCSSGCAT